MVTTPVCWACRCGEGGRKKGKIINASRVGTLGKSFLHCAGDALFHELNAFRCGVGWSERARSTLQSITLTQHTVSRPCNSENEPTLARCGRHRTQHTSSSHTRANGLQRWWFPQHCRPTASKPAGSHHVWDRHLCSSRRWTMDNQSSRQQSQIHSRYGRVGCTVLILLLTNLHLELSRVLELSNLVLSSYLFEDLLTVVGPESLGGVLAAVLQKDLFSSWVLRDSIESS